MGCSSSREALGGVVSSPTAVPAPEERWQGLRSRSLSALSSSLGMCRGRNDGAVQHGYVKLPFGEEAAVKGTAEEEAVAGSVEDAVSATSSCSAAPVVYAGAPGLVSAILPGLRQLVEDYPPSSHPQALLSPERDYSYSAAVKVTCDDVFYTGTTAARDIPEVIFTGIVRARVHELHEQMEEKKKKREEKIDPDEDDAPDAEEDDVMTPKCYQPTTTAVVIYFTSLRGVRRTFEDSRAVRAILRCYGARLDERDVSMHSAFKSELRGLLGDGYALPRVFVGGGGVHLGGADEVRALHEAGELARALATCEPAAPPAVVGACAACGDARFAVCEACHGSCKVFVDDDEGCGRLRAGCFQRCPYCNENGLIRCPVCCY